MPYVSARYAPPDAVRPPLPGAPKQIIATDTGGLEWWLDESSQVGDWLDYVARGGTIDPAPEPKE